MKRRNRTTAEPDYATTGTGDTGAATENTADG